MFKNKLLLPAVFGIVLCAALFGAHFAFGQSFDSGRAESVSTESLPPIVITHSASTTVAQGGSIACFSNSSTTVNSFWRAFDRTAFGITGAFSVDSFEFGIEKASSPGGAQPIELRFYTNTGAAFPGGTRTLAATRSYSVGNANLILVDYPVGALIPAGSGELVVEIFSPGNSITPGNTFILGANNAGQTAPSYISTPDPFCNAPNPVTMATIGFPDVHFIMTVKANAPTAATATISGRALAATGKGISDVLIRLSDAGGTRTTRTDRYGFYRFAEVQVGETYVLEAKGRRLRFAQQAQVVFLTADLEELNFLAVP